MKWFLKNGTLFLILVLMCVCIGCDDQQPKQGQKFADPGAVKDNQVTSQAGVATGGAQSYQKYVNTRYGFSIDYPADFKQDEPSANGDGGVFNSPDGQTQLSSWGSNNVLNDTTQILYDQLIADVNSRKGEIAYKVVRQDWFVLSWLEDNKIFYQKGFVGPGSVNGFVFAYPKDQSMTYDPMTNYIANSFKAGDLNEIH
jgi:hypothetical protein